MVMYVLRALLVAHFVSSTLAQYTNHTELREHGFENVDTQLPAAHGGSSLVPERSYGSQMASVICNFVPSSCSILGRYFPIGVNEARGPKDLIAIVSTMLATLLGAILVKLGVLIVLSVISIAIGKILLIVITLKSHLFGHKFQAQPIVFEKVYYPHGHGNIHRDWQPQTGQNYIDEHSPYEHTVYQR